MDLWKVYGELLKVNCLEEEKVIFKDKATAIKAINSYIEFLIKKRITLKMATLYRKYKVAINCTVYDRVQFNNDGLVLLL